MKPTDYRIPRAGEQWRHMRGDLYHIDHVGIDTETGEPDVAYFRSDEFEAYRRGGPDAVTWYHRPLGVFLASVKQPDGSHGPRFQYVSNELQEVSSDSTD